MIRVIHCHRPWVPRGSPEGIPPPLHFIECVISQKPLRSPPLRDPDLGSLWTPLGACPIPFTSWKALYLWNRLDPHPKPYIFLLIMRRYIQWPWRWVPLDSPEGMPHPFHFIKGLTETVEIPPSKPYIFLFLMIRLIHCHRPCVLPDMPTDAQKSSLEPVVRFFTKHGM